MPTNEFPNQRASYRVPAVGQRYGRLKIQDHEQLVLIVDESAKGFGILMGGKFDGAVGLVVLLQTGAGWVEAKVANISSAHVPDSPDGSGESPCTRLGLVRIRDLPSKLALTSPFALLLQLGKRPLTPFSSSWHTAIASVAFIGLGGLVLIIGIEYPGSLLDPRELRSMWREWVGPPRQSGKGAFVTSKQLFNELAPVTRPESLMQPRAVEYLELSEYQLDRLRMIARLNPSNSPERTKQALNILTREQLVRWHDLARSQGRGD